MSTEVKYGEWYREYGLDEFRKRSARMSRQFNMKIGGWISFVMQEPMSGQKMWVKKLDLDDITMSGTEYYTARGYNPGEVLYDGKIDAIADALKQMYPAIMQKCWTYIDPEEILSLKEKVKEIRELKRY